MENGVALVNAEGLMANCTVSSTSAVSFEMSLGSTIIDDIRNDNHTKFKRYNVVMICTCTISTNLYFICQCPVQVQHQRCIAYLLWLFQQRRDNRSLLGCNIADKYIL